MSPKEHCTLAEALLLLRGLLLLRVGPKEPHHLPCQGCYQQGQSGHPLGFQHITQHLCLTKQSPGHTKALLPLPSETTSPWPHTPARFSHSDNKNPQSQNHLPVKELAETTQYYSPAQAHSPTAVRQQTRPVRFLVPQKTQTAQTILLGNLFHCLSPSQWKKLPFSSKQGSHSVLSTVLCPGSGQ